MSEKLKPMPCPFCGQPLKREVDETQGDRPEWWSRTCHPDCFFEVWPHDGEVIIDSDIPAWNRRSDGY